MEELFNVLTENITLVYYGMMLFSISYLSNILFTIWYNCGVEKQKFCSQKLLMRIGKALIFGAGSILLCLSVTLVPALIEAAGITMTEEYKLAFNAVTITGLYIAASCKYIKEAFCKMVKVLNDNIKKDNIDEGAIINDQIDSVIINNIEIDEKGEIDV